MSPKKENLFEKKMARLQEIVSALNPATFRWKRAWPCTRKARHVHVFAVNNWKKLAMNSPSGRTAS